MIPLHIVNANYVNTNDMILADPHTSNHTLSYMFRVLFNIHYILEQDPPPQHELGGALCSVRLAPAAFISAK